MDCEIVKIDQFEEAVMIHFRNTTSIRFEDCWLRDHCRCPSCYNADTFQRAKSLLEIPEATIKSLKFDKHQLLVKWSDSHESTYKSDFLIQFEYKSWKNARRLKPILWRGVKVAEKVARVQMDRFLGNVNGTKEVFQSLLDYGLAFIERVDPNVEGTKKVCNALGGIQRTIFGDMWELTTKTDHADTAYTNLPLDLHNDNTYFTEAAGLQVLHCIKHVNPVGGKTILVDGFYGATCLKEESPDCFEFLTTFDVEAEYIEEGHHHRYSAPVIKMNWKTEDLLQIRFNVYDRSAIAFANSDDCRAYYRSLKKLATYYENPENQWQFKLNPGTVMVVDNFRVLHGRTAFTGDRVLCGCYVARSDWLDKARTLGLIQ